MSLPLLAELCLQFSIRRKWVFEFDLVRRKLTRRKAARLPNRKSYQLDACQFRCFRRMVICRKVNRLVPQQSRQNSDQMDPKPLELNLGSSKSKVILFLPKSSESFHQKFLIRNVSKPRSCLS